MHFSSTLALFGVASPFLPISLLVLALLHELLPEPEPLDLVGSSALELLSLAIPQEDKQRRVARWPN